VRPKGSFIVFAVLMAACVALFVAAFAWPAIAITLDAALAGKAPDDGWTFSHRQWALLGKSLLLAGLASLLCLAVSLPAACAMGKSGRITGRPMLLAALMALLLCPPMVYAFGWERIWPTQTGESARLLSTARCVVVWALWSWPVPAAIIGIGFARTGKEAYQAALLDTSLPKALLHITAPLMLRYVTISALILLVLFLGEYGVPHACGLTVFATELLGRATDSSFAIDTVWPSILPTVAILVGLSGLCLLWRWRGTHERSPRMHADERPLSRVLLGIVWAIVALSLVFPVAVLIANLKPTGAFAESLNTYWREMLGSLGIAAAAGLAAAGMGIALFAVRRLGIVALVVALVFGAIPGALIGKSLVIAYLPQAFGFIYDTWLTLAISHVSRFGWIGLLAAYLIVRSTPPDLVAQARTDGASRAGVIGRIQLPMHWPIPICASAVIAALSMSEVASSTLVRIPQINLVAHIIIEKFHRLEDGMLISLSLSLVGVGFVVAGILSFTTRAKTDGLRSGPYALL